MAIDWTAVSDRVNTLINLPTQLDIASAATKLRVKTFHLQETIDRTSRLSTLKVAAAISRVYGLDPTWILTGTFSEATLGIAVQGDADKIETLMRRIVAGDSLPALPTPDDSGAPIGV